MLDAVEMGFSLSETEKLYFSKNDFKTWQIYHIIQPELVGKIEKKGGGKLSDRYKVMN